MARKSLVIEILIASPSDLYDERNAVEDIIHSWNSGNSEFYGVILQPIRWEYDSFPSLKSDGQSVLNEQILASSDFVIAMFWSKIGMPTPRYDSGTIEEIEEARKLGKPVLLYFCNRPGMSEEVTEIKKKYQSLGLYNTFVDVTDLQKTLVNHLSKTIQGELKKDTPEKEISNNEIVESFEMLNTKSIEKAISEKKREYERKKLREEMLSGQVAIEGANNLFMVLLNQTKEHTSSIINNFSAENLKIAEDYRTLVFRKSLTNAGSCMLRLDQKSCNLVDSFSLHLDEYEGLVVLAHERLSLIRDPKLLKRIEFKVDYNEKLGYCWKANRENRLYSNLEIVKLFTDKCMNLL